MSEYVIQNIEHIDASSNEIINRHTINRNFLKLLENDKALAALMNSPEINKNNIKAFYNGNPYAKGDLIWFKDYSDDGIPVLHILRSLVDGNTNYPTKTMIDKVESYENSGWKDEYEYGTAIQTTILSYINLIFSSAIESDHILAGEFHPFGQLTESAEYNNTKLLRKDLENIDHERTTSHFPAETVVLSTDSIIQGGFYRKWDCGLLEYDILYKLGYNGEQVTINNTRYNVIHANQSVDIDESCFYSTDDADLFAQEGTLSVQLNDMFQVGMNLKCNTFSATIKLPVPFKDTSYMVFGSDIACQERNTASPTIDSGANTIIYSKKAVDSVSPLLVMFPQAGAKSSGLIANSFHCYIIGKWK